MRSSWILAVLSAFARNCFCLNATQIQSDCYDSLKIAYYLTINAQRLQALNDEHWMDLDVFTEEHLWEMCQLSDVEEVLTSEIPAPFKFVMAAMINIINSAPYHTLFTCSIWAFMQLIGVMKAKGRVQDWKRDGQMLFLGIIGCRGMRMISFGRYELVLTIQKVSDNETDDRGHDEAENGLQAVNDADRRLPGPVHNGDAGMSWSEWARSLFTRN